LAEEIIIALTKIPELKVIARASAFAFRGKEQDLRAIAQRLRVATILEGSVRRSGNRIRVTAQLIKVEDESHLWSERYDREMTDIFAIQDDISQAIANALKVKLAPRGYRSTNLEAFQSYLKGIYCYQRYTAQSLMLARQSFEDALSHDPDYAPAHAGLAVFHYGVGALSLRRMIDVAPLARASAEKALALDPALSEAHSVLGLLSGAVEYDWPAAELHFHAAMAVNPVPPLVHVRYALYFLTPLNRFTEAITQYRLALETDPLSMMVHFGLSFALYCDRRYDEAIQNAAKAVDLYPDYWLVHFAMGMALSQQGSIHQSIASFETTLRLSPSFALATGYLAALYFRAGSPTRAADLIAELEARKSSQYVSPSCFAIYHAARGHADQMFESLQAALAEREPFLTRMGAEPYFWPYRSDPRYTALLKSMNLAAD
jgi:tetratricopeptide (TPR) repeat protein